MTETCAHNDFEFVPGVMTVTDITPPFTFLTLRVRCIGCRQQFHFHGLNSGHPNPEAPVVSADGFELRAPIVAGPGAVVGLLHATGLEDRLVKPEATS